MDDVIGLLKSIKLRKYCAVFRENDIDGPTLINCKSVEDVEELGIDITAKAKFLYEEIVKLKSTEIERNPPSFDVPQNLQQHIVAVNDDVHHDSETKVRIMHSTLVDKYYKSLYIHV